MQNGLFALSLMLLASGCSDEADGCGKSLTYADGACVAAASGGSGGSASGGASSTGGAGGGAVPDGFGEICAVHEDCTGDTNYCAESPLDPEPYCTASGCDAEASVCPDGWTCFDVGQFAPGEPHICAKP